MNLHLEPGETRTLAFLLGFHENPAEAKFDPPGSGRAAVGAVERIIERYRDDGVIQEAREARLDRLVV